MITKRRGESVDFIPKLKAVKPCSYPIKIPLIGNVGLAQIKKQVFEGFKKLLNGGYNKIKHFNILQSNLSMN